MTYLLLYRPKVQEWLSDDEHRRAALCDYEFLDDPDELLRIIKLWFKNEVGAEDYTDDDIERVAVECVNKELYDNDITSFEAVQYINNGRSEFTT